MKKIFVTLLIAFVGVSYAFSQHDVGPALSSQLFSRINFNPAGIGNSEKINIFSMNRLQWAGFEGKPMTSVLNVHYFNENWKSGFGASLMYDNLGFSNRAINAKLTYAYNLDLSADKLLLFGVAAGIDQFAKDYSGDRVSNLGTAALENESKINPDFDFGVEFSMPFLLLGASVNHIGYLKAQSTLSPTQTYYGYARGRFDITKEIMLSPSLLYMNSGQTNIFDINATVFLRDMVPDFMFWAGLGWRSGAKGNVAGSALSIPIGMEWSFLRFGYAYELGFGVGNYNTHELTLSFIIPTKSNKSATAKKKR